MSYRRNVEVKSLGFNCIPNDESKFLVVREKKSKSVFYITSIKVRFI